MIHIHMVDIVAVNVLLQKHMCIAMENDAEKRIRAEGREQGQGTFTEEKIQKKAAAKHHSMYGGTYAHRRKRCKGGEKTRLSSKP